MLFYSALSLMGKDELDFWVVQNVFTVCCWQHRN